MLLLLLLMLLLLLLVVLVGQYRRGNLLWGPYGILEGEEVESRSSSIIGIVRLITIGIIGAAVGFVAHIVGLVSSVGLRIEGWGSGANAKSAIEYTIECIEGVRGDGGGIGGGLTSGSAVYDGEEGSRVGGWRWEGATPTSDKGSETGSGNIWGEASSDKGTVESTKAQRSLIGGTGKHGRGKRTSTKGVAHRPT